MTPIVVITSTTPTLSDLTERVRRDLFDAGQRAGDEPRWQDLDIVRALDRSNDKYSSAAPLLKLVLIPTTKLSRLYPTPPDAWYVDAVEFPYGQWPRWQQPFQERLSIHVDPPSVPGSVSFEGGGSLSSGDYTWACSFVTPGGGETTPAFLASGTATPAERANLSSLPVGPYGIVDRNIYRTTAGGSNLFLIRSVGDNSSTAFVDILDDATLATHAPAPTVNTTGSIPQVELQISDSRLPVDGSQHIGLRYATKHQLDGDGTSIPERHWDVLCLGAEMFAIMAYLVPTADNFRFQDGQFRDQIDDSKTSAAWLAIGVNLEQRLETRLAEIKNEDNANVAAIGSWGDKPERWDRL